jgi:hypothetical protein
MVAALPPEQGEMTHRFAIFGTKKSLIQLTGGQSPTTMCWKDIHMKEKFKICPETMNEGHNWYLPRYSTETRQPSQELGRNLAGHHCE